MKSKLIYLSLALFFSGTMVFSQDYVMRDLEGAKGRDAESTLQNRGYHHVKTDKAGYNIYSYWWRWQNKECVCARIEDGRVRSVVKAPAFDCNKNEDGTARHYNRYTHSSVAHHPSGKNYSTQLERQAFERGYRDGNHHKGYNNVYRNAARTAREAYDDGYKAGKDNRRGVTGYHSNNTHEPSKEYWDWHHLVGRQHVSAHNELLKNGWEEVHAYNLNNRRHKVYYRELNGQCIEVIHDTNRVIAIHHNEKCKSYMD